MLAQEWDKESRKPPSDEDRLELFSDLARQYEVATRSLRTMDPTPSHHDNELVHGRFVRAALLRKFFLGRDDQVHLDKVVESLTAEARAAGNFDQSRQARYEYILRTFQELDAKGEVTFEDGPTKGEYPALDVFELITYGNVLHADYGKWRHTRSIGGPAFIFSLSHTVHRMEQLLLTLLEAVVDVLGDTRGKVRT